jgi:hypothetical protein
MTEHLGGDPEPDDYQRFLQQLGYPAINRQAFGKSLPGGEQSLAPL